MKEQQNILIITGSPDANKTVRETLIGAGCSPFRSKDTGAFPEAAVIFFNTENASFKCASSPCGWVFSATDQFTVYKAADLTSELCRSFPGAKELPPEGVFNFEGREYVVDGDCKRPAQRGDICFGENYSTAAYRHSVSNSGMRWHLRPLISEELQAAMDEAEESRLAINNLRTGHSAVKEAMRTLNVKHKANLERVKELGG